MNKNTNYINTKYGLSLQIVKSGTGYDVLVFDVKETEPKIIETYPKTSLKEAIQTLTHISNLLTD